MGKFVDLTGQKFGRWTVLERAANRKSGATRWLCQCDCGTQGTVSASSLKGGDSRSCGHERTKDPTGQRFGKWTVLGPPLEGPNKNKTGRAVWQCRCDCGTERGVSGDRLRNVGSTSCGCERVLARPGRVGQNKYLTRYKNSAAYRGFEWGLTDEQALLLAVQNCYYCDAAPSNRSQLPAGRTSTRVLNNGTFLNNGIDRIDSSKGYFLDNVVTCCKICNRSKGDLSLDQWLIWLANIAKYRSDRRS